METKIKVAKEHMSDKEEEVNKDKLLKKIDHLVTTDNNQDFQNGCH